MCEMGKYVNFYCGNNNKELEKIVDQIIIKRFGWLPQKDYDDFYSIAAQVVWDCEKVFDSQKVKSEEFKSFLSSCLYNKIKSQLTYMHRDKRVLKDDEGNPIYEICIDAPLDDDENGTLGDLLSGGFDMEREVLGEDEEYSAKTLQYLGKLSKLQREVLQLIIVGYSPNEIREELHITKKQYTDCNAAIHSYRNVSVLL